MSKIIAFAGLPGTGKTTLATLLAERLGAVLLNKDAIRAALFADELIEYSDKQNDFCMEIIYSLSEYHLETHPHRPVIIDGRTYARSKQIEALLSCVNRCQCQLSVIECKCSLEVILARVKQDEGKHLAVDRTVAMVKRAHSQAEPLELPRLVIWTDTGSPERNLDQIVSYVNENRPVE